jgi:hypothetical protein
VSLPNAGLRALLDLLLVPLGGLPPVVGLAALALLTAVAMLLVFRAFSDQERLAQVKRSLQACLFEIRLFNDDLRAILRAQGEVLRHNLTYLRLSLPPMLWLLPPLVLLLAHLQGYYGYRGLAPGERALVKVFLEPAPGGHGEGGAAAKPEARLAAPEGVAVETGPVWIPSRRELAWRVRAERSGRYELRAVVAGETHGKSLVVSDRVVRRSPVRVRAGLVRQLLNPAEDPLPGGGAVASIEVGYPAADAGWGVHWVVAYFVLTVVFALALRRRFGVVI